MAESWPMYIHHADINWTITTKENLVRFSPERGRSKARRISTKAVETLSISLTLNAWEFRVFRKWYEEELNYGLNDFYFPDFVDDGDDRLARFSSVPQWARADEKNWTVTATIEYYK